MARRTKEEALQTREALLDAAEVVFLRRGVAGASLDEVAKEAGVTRGAVYHHFENKTAIFHAMHDRVKSPLDILFDELVGGDDPLAGLQKMCVHVMCEVERDERTRNVFAIMRQHEQSVAQDDPELQQELKEKRVQVLTKFARVFTHVSKQGMLEKGITPDFAAIALHSFISGVFWDYLREPASYPLSRMAPKLVECFFRGMIKHA